MPFSELFMTLVEQTWAGDRKAFEQLYYHLFRYLVSYIGDSDAASDLAQDTLAKAWDKWPERHDVSHVKKWLFRIATNLAIDYIRRRQKNPTYSFETIAPYVEEGSVATLVVTHGSDFPETYLEQIEEQDRLRFAMAGVPVVLGQKPTLRIDYRGLAERAMGFLVQWHIANLTTDGLQIPAVTLTDRHRLVGNVRACV